MQASRDEAIFAFGDCAACHWGGREETVPPRAQAAHRQASLLAKAVTRRVNGQPPMPFRYRNFGSLVSLGGTARRAS